LEKAQAAAAPLAAEALNKTSLPPSAPSKSQPAHGSIDELEEAQTATALVTSETEVTASPSPNVLSKSQPAQDAIDKLEKTKAAAADSVFEGLSTLFDTSVHPSTTATEATPIEATATETTPNEATPNEAEPTINVLSSSGNISSGMAFWKPQVLTQTLEWPKDKMPEAEWHMCRYWGHLITPTGISPLLNLLIIAICDMANAITDARPPMVPVHKAAVYIMPETFASILLMFGIEDPAFGPVEVVRDYGPQLFDDIFAQYYIAFGLPIVWATRPGGRRQKKLPLITRQAVKTWGRNYIRAQPDEILKRINAMLHELPELTHPLEDKQFLYKQIPRQCAPATGDQAVITTLVKAFAKFQAACKRVMSAAKPMQMSQQSRQEYLNVVENARIQKEYFLNINGGWTKDEYGRDKYVGSCIF
jgi:hypothetical protein